MKRFAAVAVIALVALALCADALPAQGILQSPVNGWYLKEVRGIAPLEATTRLVPAGGFDGNCVQLFRYAIGNSPPPILIFEKQLPRDVLLPRAIQFSIYEHHIGSSRENFAKMWVYIGNADSVYPLGNDNSFVPWLHFSPTTYAAWDTWAFLTELVALDSIDRVQLWFTFAADGPDTAEIRIGSLEALVGAPPFIVSVIDAFGGPLPPALIQPRAETQDDHGIHFQWNASEGALKYRIQVSTDRNFSHVVADDSISSDTARTLSGLSASNSYWWRVRAKNLLGWGPWGESPSFIITSVKDVKEVPSGIPSEFRLDQNYPNPFNPTTMVRFALPVASTVKLRVLSPLGQEIAVLAEGRMGPGVYEADWNASGHASGIYFYELSTGTARIVKRMVLVR